MSEGTIFKVWGDNKGWVSLPRKLRKTPKAKDGSWEEGEMFKWPEGKEAINSWIQDSVTHKYDLYWCPCVFEEPRRVKRNIYKMNILYADLDEVNPQELAIKPSVAWASSPNRYAAIWFLDRNLPAQEAERLNKNLTYAIGADKGGWDLTQVLRVPGLRNYKYEGAPKGKLLWFNSNPIPSSRFTQLPDAGLNELVELPQEEVLESDIQLLPELIRPYITKLNPKVLELLFTSADEVAVEDRSARLWELEHKLIEGGVPKEDVIKIVASSNWNKYKGRGDETKRIVSEVEKISQENVPSLFMKKVWVPYEDLMAQKLDNPGWMIEGIWQRTSHGIIAGEPKTYKSIISTDMAVSVASGQPFMGKFAVHHRGPVLMIQEENAPWLVQDRVSKIASHRGLLTGEVSDKPIIVKFPEMLPIYFLNNMGFDLTNKEDQKFIELAAQEKKPVLIIFDSLYLMLGGKDENSAKDLREVLEWLLRLRYLYHTSVVVLHHWNKGGKSERGGQRMLGSVTFHAWVESALYTSILNEENHEIVLDREFRSFVKPNKIDIRFDMGDPGNLHYIPHISDHREEEGDALFDLLTNSMSIEELADMLSIPQKQVKSRISKLMEEKKVEEVSKGVYRVRRTTETGQVEGET